MEQKSSMRNCRPFTLERSCGKNISGLLASAGGLAKRLGVPRTRIERLVLEETSITIDTALRLGRFFGTSPDLWMSMQTGYDFKLASAEKAEALKAITPLEAA